MEEETSDGNSGAKAKLSSAELVRAETGIEDAKQVQRALGRLVQEKADAVPELVRPRAKAYVQWYGVYASIGDEE
jgi:hypothetical protein